MNDKFEEIQKLIEENRNIVNFGQFGEGVSEQWISKAENYLGIKLPLSYIWWLMNYGGGEVGGEEIFSIYEQNFETIVGGDIVRMHILNQRKHSFDKHQLVVCVSDLDGVFFFNVNEKDEQGEYPVYSAITKRIYAKNFLDFLKKRILSFK